MFHPHLPVADKSNASDAKIPYCCAAKLKQVCVPREKDQRKEKFFFPHHANDHKNSYKRSVVSIAAISTRLPPPPENHGC